MRAENKIKLPDDQDYRGAHGRAIG